MTEAIPTPFDIIEPLAPAYVVTLEDWVFFAAVSVIAFTVFFVLRRLRGAVTSRSSVQIALSEINQLELRIDSLPVREIYFRLTLVLRRVLQEALQSFSPAIHPIDETSIDITSLDSYHGIYPLLRELSERLNEIEEKKYAKDLASAEAKALIQGINATLLQYAPAFKLEISRLMQERKKRDT